MALIATFIARTQAHGLDQDVVTVLQQIRRTVPAIPGGSPVFLHRQRGGDVE